MKEKAYILLAKQENISNRKAKELIDRGLVYARDKKVKIARGLMPVNTRFKIIKLPDIRKIYEDENILVVDKPPFIVSEEIAQKFKLPLLHRLDKETSGILLLVKNDEFKRRAIKEFKNKNVYKEYIAWVEGIVAEPEIIDLPIEIKKTKSGAFAKISPKGEEAVTEIEPILAFRTKSKIKAVIHTGRTHQIRAHLKAIDHPIIGDIKYGGREYNRVMLHHHKFKIFDYEFISPEPKDFKMQEEKGR
ncbi:23S rRNA pseudouridine1911/1915/1917 synthase [Lebetimonas natsushimae]|uniref:RNA pseudouridylate synthase n=1 Tax=Lebetimonas natsushimae TaxID=1936991 RepID=A0A292YAQ5_9BACT|nr:RNA pseudouridine synthase [Lebetimonas natsushimae]GAX87147.1 23S rRNA pseudouridine1911/1915/1917 synthase [Lebetimonas natsushimae]